MCFFVFFFEMVMQTRPWCSRAHNNVKTVNILVISTVNYIGAPWQNHPHNKKLEGPTYAVHEGPQRCCPLMVARDGCPRNL